MRLLLKRGGPAVMGLKRRPNGIPALLILFAVNRKDRCRRRRRGEERDQDDRLWMRMMRMRMRKMQQVIKHGKDCCCRTKDPAVRMKTGGPLVEARCPGNPLEMAGGMRPH